MPQFHACILVPSGMEPRLACTASAPCKLLSWCRHSGLLSGHQVAWSAGLVPLLMVVLHVVNDDWSWVCSVWLAQVLQANRLPAVCERVALWVLPHESGTCQHVAGAEEQAVPVMV